MAEPSDDDQRLYSDLSWIWPWISPLEESREEVAVYTDAIRKYDGPRSGRLLDLGCGGGHNSHFLSKRYSVTGIDLSDGMLEVARVQAPDASFSLGDMRIIDLGLTFDVVLVADAIGYMLNEDDLKATLENVRRHLAPDGIALLAPDEVIETHVHGIPTTVIREREGITIEVREENFPLVPGTTEVELELAYTITHTDGRIERHKDRHRQGLFPEKTWESIIEAAGLTLLEHDQDGDAHLFVVRRA